MPDAVPQTVLEVPDSGARIVTANPRLAVWMRRRHDAARRARGASTWPAPAIASFEEWMAAQWQEALLWNDPPPAETLLTPMQERYLWEELLRRRSGARESLDLAATARAALEAWEWLHAWRLDLDAPAWDDSPDCGEFRDWARRYRELCRDSGWLSSALLPDRLAPRGDLARPLLAGFETMPPQQTELFDRYGATRTQLESRSGHEPHAEIFPSPEAELRAAARWARERVEAGAMSVAVVSTNLGALRDLAERVFLEELHPGRAVWDQSPRAFEISLGPPLAEYPIVAAALDLLELAAAPDGLEWPTVSRLLRSPYLPAGEAGRNARARIEYRLRNEGTTRLTLRRLATHAREVEPLLQTMDQAAPPRRTAGAAAWAAAFDRLLAACGWPGATALNSSEHQARDAWNNLLGDFARLETVGAREAVSAALARLRRMARERIFQPQSAPAPIQLLGWTEAAGMTFDAIWIAGLDDGNAPAAPRPNPFLPWHMQMAAGLPRSSAGRERNIAQSRFASLLRAAPLTRIGCAVSDLDGNPLLPSPLAPALRLLAPTPATAAPEPWLQLEALNEPHAAPLPLPRPEDERFGSSLFADQAACPFRAFAHARLRAVAAPAANWGLSSAQRGQLAHAALAEAWSQVSTSHRLHELHASGSLAAVLDAAARAAVERETAFAAWPWLREPEEQRLRRLLGEWFEIELRRPESFSVQSREESASPLLGGLPLRLRLDRIDLLAGGERVIVDYKTGRPEEPDWNDAGLQPQLPLYAATAPTRPPLAGVAIAALPEDPAEARVLEYFACAAREGVFETAEIVPDFDAQVRTWRERLETLAREFLAGSAAVRPRDGLKTCRFCDLTPLCRVHDTLLPGDDEDDDE